MLTTNRETDCFLEQTSVAVIGTTNQDGTSHLAPIWFTWKENRAYMFTNRNSIKWRNIQRKAQATLCVDHRNPPYSYIILYGLITEIDMPLYQLVKPMAIKYYGLNKGKDFAETFRDSSSFVAFTLNPYHIVEKLEL
jgi:hypothetical protein